MTDRATLAGGAGRAGRRRRTRSCRSPLSDHSYRSGQQVFPHPGRLAAGTGCGICEINCPNGTIEVITKTIITEDGKKKRAIDKHIYRLGMCTFCALCVKTCPSNALAFSQEFEHSVFDRSKLIKVSNKPGSQLMKGVE